MECSLGCDREKDNNATRNQQYDNVMITYQMVDYFSNREGKSFLKKKWSASNWLVCMFVVYALCEHSISYNDMKV